MLEARPPGPVTSKSSRFIEDEGPEWRELDYILEVRGARGGEGEGSSYLLTWNDLGWGAAHNILWVLSTIWLEFLQDFRWSNTSGGKDNNRQIISWLRTLCFQEIEERKNLLNQFRKWKKRKRKTFNIVVTERSRREMAEQEEEKNKKRIPPQK